MSDDEDEPVQDEPVQDGTDWPTAAVWIVGWISIAFMFYCCTSAR